MSTEALKACPLCQCEAELVETEREDNDRAPRPHRVYAIQCTSCEVRRERESPDWWSGSTAPAVTANDEATRAALITAWNRRAPDDLPAVKAELAAARRERDEARAWAREWHRVCEVIATVLGLPEPEANFADIVRDKFETLEVDRATTAESALSALRKEVMEVLEPIKDRCIEAVRADDADTSGVTIRTSHLRAARALADKIGGSHG